MLIYCIPSKSSHFNYKGDWSIKCYKFWIHVKKWKLISICNILKTLWDQLDWLRLNELSIYNWTIYIISCEIIVNKLDFLPLVILLLLVKLEIKWRIDFGILTVNLNNLKLVFLNWMDTYFQIRRCNNNIKFQIEFTVPWYVYIPNWVNLDRWTCRRIDLVCWIF